MELKSHILGVEGRKHIHSCLVFLLQNYREESVQMKGRDAVEMTPSVMCLP